MESTVLATVKWLVEVGDGLNNLQTGFLHGLSAENKPALIHHALLEKTAGHTEDIFCFSKAFDSVLYHTVIRCIKKLGWGVGPSNLRSFFLTDRRHPVLLGKTKEPFMETKLGVPQGVVGSHLLFNVMTEKIAL